MNLASYYGKTDGACFITVLKAYSDKLGLRILGRFDMSVNKENFVVYRHSGLINRLENLGFGLVNKRIFIKWGRKPGHEIKWVNFIDFDNIESVPVGNVEELIFDKVFKNDYFFKAKKDVCYEYDKRVFFYDRGKLFKASILSCDFEPSNHDYVYKLVDKFEVVYKEDMPFCFFKTLDYEERKKFKFKKDVVVE